MKSTVIDNRLTIRIRWCNMIANLTTPQDMNWLEDATIGLSTTFNNEQIPYHIASYKKSEMTNVSTVILK